MSDLFSFILSLHSCTCIKAVENESLVALCSAPYFPPRLWKLKEDSNAYILGQWCRCHDEDLYRHLEQLRIELKRRTDWWCEILEAVQFGLVTPIAENATDLQTISWVPVFCCCLPPSTEVCPSAQVSRELLCPRTSGPALCVCLSLWAPFPCPYFLHPFPKLNIVWYTLYVPESCWQSWYRV